MGVGVSMRFNIGDVSEIKTCFLVYPFIDLAHQEIIVFFLTIVSSTNHVTAPKHALCLQRTH